VPRVREGIAKLTDTAGAVVVNMSQGNREESGTTFSRLPKAPAVLSLLINPGPRPLSASGRGARQFFSPSPLRGGGWGEGFFNGPLTHCCKGLSIPELVLRLRIKIHLQWRSCTFRNFCLETYDACLGDLCL
jgi:hypothetical protein